MHSAYIIKGQTREVKRDEDGFLLLGLRSARFNARQRLSMTHPLLIDLALQQVAREAEPLKHSPLRRRTSRPITNQVAKFNLGG